MACALASEIIILESPVGTPLRDSSVRVPQPASIDPPDNDTPRAFAAPVETSNPASSASPPEALTIVAPSTVN